MRFLPPLLALTAAVLSSCSSSDSGGEAADPGGPASSLAGAGGAANGAGGAVAAGGAAAGSTQSVGGAAGASGGAAAGIGGAFGEAGGSNAGAGGDNAGAGAGGSDAGMGGAAGSGGDMAGAGGESAGNGGSAGASGGQGGSGGDGCGVDPVAPEEVLGTSAADPAGGVFTMADALDGLPDGPGPLRALIDTDLGLLSCELRPDVAPNGVANFVGLARGRRPWADPVAKHWVKRRFYDGLLFHRVIPNFVAQGGDPLGTGFGGPGYQFDDEIGSLKHVAGTLAYANAGADTNGSQFYVAEKPQASLDGKFTIFGLCTPVTVVTALTHVKTTGANGNPADRPIVDLHMKTVTITRCAP